MTHRVPVAIAAYLAGIVDGEGCIEISKRTSPRRQTPSYVARIRVGMSHEATMRFLAKWLPGSIRLNVRKPREGSSYSPMYCWEAISRNAEKTLTILFPYLRTKKIEAEIVMRFIRLVNAGGHRTRVLGYYTLLYNGAQIPRRANSEKWVNTCERMYTLCRSFKSGKGRRNYIGKVA